MAPDYHRLWITGCNPSFIAKSAAAFYNLPLLSARKFHLIPQRCTLRRSGLSELRYRRHMLKAPLTSMARAQNLWMAALWNMALNRVLRVRAICCVSCDYITPCWSQQFSILQPYGKSRHLGVASCSGAINRLPLRVLRIVLNKFPRASLDKTSL